MALGDYLVNFLRQAISQKIHRRCKMHKCKNVEIETGLDVDVACCQSCAEDHGNEGTLHVKIKVASFYGSQCISC